MCARKEADPACVGVRLRAHAAAPTFHPLASLSLQYLELIGDMPQGPVLDAANQSAWDTLLLEAQERRDGDAAQVGGWVGAQGWQALLGPAAL